MAKSDSEVMKFSGKRLLMLGSNVGSVEVLKYAKANGAFTIVADYLPKEKSIAKQYCDKCVLISTADTEKLSLLIQTEKINGVFAGVSEFNLLQAMKLCRLNNLSFYCDMEQWNKVEIKDQFRKLCDEFNIPTPKTFYYGDSPDEIGRYMYPVVVKPVDSSSSIGVSICHNENSCLDAIALAKKNSLCGNIIIEEFFEGEEFTAHYSIVQGKASLVCVDNRFAVSVNGDHVTTVPIARIYPSSFLMEYKNQVNDKVVEMCDSLALEVGVLFVQGLYNRKSNRFCIFEGGLRSAGEAPFRFVESVNGTNYMNALVDYAMLGEASDYDNKMENPELKGKSCAVISFVSKGGRISRIIGFDGISKTVHSIISTECRYKEGDEIPKGNTLRQIVLRFVLVCGSKEELKKDIDYINSNVYVLNENGADMCIRFDPNRMFS